MSARTLTSVLVLTAAALASPVAAQSAHFDLGIGHQWLDITGNQDVQRTQTGDRSGALVDSFSLLVSDTDGSLVFDRLRISAAGVGASPYTTVRLDLERARAYSLKVTYSRAELFNALPGLANPFLASSVTPGQHTVDRRRELFNVDLELLPGRTVTPLVGYSRSRYRGPATTTYTLGNDEFRLDSDLAETVDELRVGLAFSVASWHATVLHGWRSADWTERMTMMSRAGDGNGSRPFLGRQVYATELDRSVTGSVDAPFTTAFVNGSLGSRVRVVASYARADGKAESSLIDGASGQFIALALRRFFEGLVDTVEDRATNPSWHGEARIEAELLSWLDLTVGYSTMHRELDGRALLSSSYSGTTDYSGFDPRDVDTLIDVMTAWQRDEDAGELKLIARPLSWLRLWGSVVQATQDMTINADAAEIVLPGSQGGSFSRDIDRLGGGADLSVGPVTVAAEWSKDDAGTAVVRSDYLERERLRARAKVKIGSFLRVGAMGERVESSNPTPGIAYEATVEHWSADLEVTPVERVTIFGSYHRYDSDSRITIRRPHDFVLEPSVYLEDGDNVEGSLNLDLGALTVLLGANRYSNQGSLPFDLDRRFGRVDLRFSETLGVYGQWEHREYSEALLPLADYNSDRWGLFLRVTSK